LDLVECSITNEAGMDAIFAAHSFDAVIHFAALRFVGDSVSQPVRYYDTNLNGSLVLFRLMAKHGVKAIAFSSSGTVYGGSPSPLVEATSETGKGILNPYSFSKYVIERMLEDVYTADPTMQIAVLRYFNPCGAHPSGTIGEDPNGKPSSLFPFTLQVLTKRRAKLTVFGDDFPTRDGTCIRDYVHVVDIAEAHAKAIAWLFKSENAGGIFDNFNLGTGTGSTVLEVIAALGDAAGFPVPHDIGGRREGDLAVTYCVPDKAKAILGWEAQYTLPDMCKHAWNWSQQNPQGYPKPEEAIARAEQ
jgi:UDP-glucose 4-epimerase